MEFMPKLQWDICGPAQTVKDSFGFKIQVSKVLNDLSRYDVIIVPGGFGTRDLVNDQQYMTWISTAQKVPLKVSVCTGALLLGAPRVFGRQESHYSFRRIPYSGKVLPGRPKPVGSLPGHYQRRCGGVFSGPGFIFVRALGWCQG